MKKCWNEDPLNRPSASEVNQVIENWIFRTKHVIQVAYLILLDLGSSDENTSKKLNEILESEDSQATSVKTNEMLLSEDLSDYIIKDLRSLDIKTDEIN
ncbi:unnamed protein product [Rhizophagus irregularis]|nr:unnamed protein product [Rhizophagus irregularis]